MNSPLDFQHRIDGIPASGETNTDCRGADSTSPSHAGRDVVTPDEDRLQELLDRWETLRERGEKPSDEELCREAPELLGEFRHRVQIVEAMEGFLTNATLVTRGGRPNLEQGQFRLGGYEILQKLGQGGMGAVYLARQLKLQRKVAVKFLPRDRMQDRSAVARFEREMAAVGALNHDHIVQAHDAGEIDGCHFLVMELVDGENLLEILQRVGPLKIPDACELIRQAAVGL